MRKLLQFGTLFLAMAACASAQTKLRLHDYPSGVAGYKAMTLSLGPKGGSVLSLITNTVAGASDIQVTNAPGGTAQQWISEPLSSGLTLSGPVTCNVYGGESNAAADASFRCRLFKYTGGSESAPILTAEMSNVLSTSATTARTWTGTPAGTSFAPGDRIVFKLFLENCATSPCPAGIMAGSQSVTAHYNGDSDAADGSSWVQLSETATFDPEGGAGSFAAEPVVQYATGSIGGGNDGKVSIYHAKFPSATQSGNCMFVVGSSQNNVGTLTVTDDSGGANSWIAGPVSPLSENQVSWIFYSMNIAAGTRAVDIHASSASGTNFMASVVEVANCATAAALDASSANAGTGSSASAGSLTPNYSGDLILQFTFVSNVFKGGGTSSFGQGSQPNIAWKLGMADVVRDNKAFQYGVYNSTAPLNPTMGLSSSLESESVAIAIRPSATGKMPTGFRIRSIQHVNLQRFAGTYTEQIPCAGNLLVLMAGGTVDYDVSSISDGRNTFTKSGPTNSGVVTFYAGNASCSSTETVTVNDKGGNGYSTHIWYDIVGAAASPLDVEATPIASDLTTPGTMKTQTIKPAGPGEIILTDVIVSLDTVNGISGGGALLDNFWYTGVTGDSPCDRNNGWGHAVSVDNSPITFSWTFLFGGPPQGWEARALAFKPGSGGGANPPPPDTQSPTAPASLTAIPSGSSQINLSWAASTDNVGVTQYLVESCQGAGCTSFSQVGTTPGTAFNHTGLASSTAYSYRVRAMDAAGNLSAYSDVTGTSTQTSAGDTQAPTAPSTLTAAAVTASQINLNWTASGDNVAVTQYSVEGCQGSTCLNFTPVGTASGTVFSSLGLVSNTAYRYRVRAADAAGNFSAYSNIAGATTPASQSNDSTPPTAPTALFAAGVSGSQINLNWRSSRDNVGVSQYLIERCEGTTCTNFAQVGTSPGTSFSSLGLTGSTSYRHRVRAQDAAGQMSGYSNVASARTATVADQQAPTPPQGLTATGVSGSQITLSWSASTDNVRVTQYFVESCQGSGCANFVEVGTSTGTGFTHTGLLPGTVYAYRVRATDAAGNLSTYSNLANTSTLAGGSPVPPTASGLVAAYTFNEDAGPTATDMSGNGNTGTLVNATWTNSGKYGGALVFNGSNALVTINDSASLHLTNGMTLEAWVMPTPASSKWQDAIYKGGNDNYILEATTPNSARPGGGATLGSNDIVIFGSSPMVANNWTHLALTYDGTTLRLYVNGTLASSRASTGTILTTSTPLQIGGDTFWGQYFAGTIDEVRVYNVALSQAQIQADMATPLGQ